jgi:hypothetical protein
VPPEGATCADRPGRAAGRPPPAPGSGSGCELGGALGIAVLGSLVLATYRHSTPGPPLAEAVGLPGPVLTTREDGVAAPAG